MSDETKPQTEQSENQTVERKDDPEANPNGPDYNKVDSIGAPKDENLVGPRGVNAPRDAKPAPQKRATKADVNNVTAKVDSAGNPKDPTPIGPRGPYATHVRDTYKP